MITYFGNSYQLQKRGYENIKNVVDGNFILKNVNFSVDNDDLVVPINSPLILFLKLNLTIIFVDFSFFKKWHSHTRVVFTRKN